MRYQSRMSEFSINNAKKAKYSCEKQHKTVDSFYNCHCTVLARTAHWSFYAGSVFVCLASALMVFTHFELTFNNLTAGYIFLMTTIFTVLCLGSAHYFFPTNVRLDKHEDEDDKDHLYYHYRDVDYNPANLYKGETNNFEIAAHHVEQEVLGAKKVMTVDGASRAISEMMDIPHSDHSVHSSHSTQNSPVGTPHSRRRRPSPSNLTIPKDVFVQDVRPSSHHGSMHRLQSQEEPSHPPPTYAEAGANDWGWAHISRVFNAFSPFKPPGRPAPPELDPHAPHVPQRRLTRRDEESRGSILRPRPDGKPPLTPPLPQRSHLSQRRSTLRPALSSSTDSDTENPPAQPLDAGSQEPDPPVRRTTSGRNAQQTAYPPPGRQTSAVRRSTSVSQPKAIPVIRLQKHRTASEIERELEAPQGYRVSPEPPVIGLQEALPSELLTLENGFDDAMRHARQSLGDAIMLDMTGALEDAEHEEEYPAPSARFPQASGVTLDPQIMLESEGEDDDFHSLGDHSSIFSTGELSPQPSFFVRGRARSREGKKSKSNKNNKKKKSQQRSKSEERGRKSTKDKSGAAGAGVERESVRMQQLNGGDARSVDEYAEADTEAADESKRLRRGFRFFSRKPPVQPPPSDSGATGADAGANGAAPPNQVRFREVDLLQSGFVVNSGGTGVGGNGGGGLPVSTV